MDQIDTISPRRRSLWSRLRWVILGLAGLLVFVLLIVDIVTVQTNSMWPLLQGDPNNGDRLLVSRTSFWFKDPKRFEIAVFNRASENGANPKLIKRIGGLPREHIQAIGGDLIVDGKIIRKPSSSFDDLLVPVVRWQPSQGREPDFQFDSNQGEIRDSGLVLDTRGQSRVEPLRFAKPVTDAGGLLVGDQRLRLRFRLLENQGWIRLGLTVNEARIKVRIGSEGAGGGVEIRHFRPGDANGHLESRDFEGLKPGVDSLLEVFHIDRRVGVILDGIALIPEYVYPPIPETPAGILRNGPDIEILDSKALVHEISIDRDVHIPSEGRLATGHIVAPDSYFVIGDNPSESIDSRFETFGDVPKSQLIGRPVLVWSPRGRRRIF